MRHLLRLGGLLVLAACIPACSDGGGETTVYLAETDADLSGLGISAGSLSPAFSRTLAIYEVAIPGYREHETTFTPTAVNSSAQIKVNGASVSSGSTSSAVDLPLGDTRVEIEVTAPGSLAQRVYIVRFHRRPVLYVKASDASSIDQFGNSIAASGDTIVVGARRAPNGGAAYVYRRTAGVWAEEAILRGAHTEVGDRFGESVAVDGDTIVVGARDESGGTSGINGDELDNSLPVSGAAYVFVRVGTTWSQQAYLKASNPDSGDNFGVAVAVSGNRVVVGAPLESSNAVTVNGDGTNNLANHSGAAYAFLRTGNAWAPDGYLKPTNTASDDVFGYSVAISGDLIAVGAPGESSNATTVNGDETNNLGGGSGAGYIFTRGAAVWSKTAYLKGHVTVAMAFGTSIALDNDTVAVGTLFSAGPGFVRVFHLAAGSWAPQQLLTTSTNFTYFGYSVALNGDTLVIGAPNDSSAGSFEAAQVGTLTTAGAATVWTRSAGIWTLENFLKPLYSEAGNQFGGAVAVSGDVVGIGIPAEDNLQTGLHSVFPTPLGAAQDSGAVYIFTR